MTGQHLGHSYIRNNGNPKGRKKDPKDTSGLAFFPGQNPIPDETVTMAEVLKAQGYRTAAIGKWGLGFEGSPGDPNRQGFDLFYGFYCQIHAHNHYPKYLWRNQEKVILKGNNRTLDGEQHSQDLFTKEALSFIRESKDEPFFLFFSSQDIHVPRAPHKRFHGKSELGLRGDAMVALDWAAGEIINSLEANGLVDNTIVIFSSDNGPVYDDGYDDGTTVHTSTKESDRGHDGSGPYRGGKYQIYEGGTRVPLIVRWPGKVKPGKSKALVSQIDLLASFAKMLDVELAHDEARDSRENLDAFLGKDLTGSAYIIEEARGVALRKGSWKYIQGKGKNASELYDLSSDVGEQHNVIQANEAIALDMQAMLKKLVDAKHGIRKSGG